MRALFLLFICFPLVLPRSANAITIYQIDTGKTTVRKFDAKKLVAYNSDKEFDYSLSPVKGEGIGSLISYYLSRFIYKLMTLRAGSISMYDVLLYGLIAFAAVMIVLQVFRVRISGFFSRDPAPILNYKISTENILETDFESLIRDAKIKEDFRLATRLWYLKTLKMLSEAGKIKWQTNKTNFEYYYELRGDNFRKNFYDLTLVFESVWYGNHEISEETFSQHTMAFNRFLESIPK